MRLLVRRGNKKSFHPRLTLESTRYCPSGQWCCVMFHPEARVGLKTIHDLPTVEEAVDYYFSEMKRCGHEAVYEAV